MTMPTFAFLSLPFSPPFLPTPSLNLDQLSYRGGYRTYLSHLPKLHSMPVTSRSPAFKMEIRPDTNLYRRANPALAPGPAPKPDITAVFIPEPTTAERSLQDLFSKIVKPTTPETKLIHLGTMQEVNELLANRPVLDFINSILRACGQLLFANNPISGALVVLAVGIENHYILALALLGAIVSNFTAMALRLDKSDIQNGCFALLGFVIGGILAIFSQNGQQMYGSQWIIMDAVLSVAVVFAQISTGKWIAKHLKVVPLSVALQTVILPFFFILYLFPQLRTLFNTGPPPPPLVTGSFDASELIKTLPMSVGQNFFTTSLFPVILVNISVGICSPMNLLMCYLGTFMYFVAGYLVGSSPQDMYSGAYGFNGALAAVAMGGIFYAPSRISVSVGAFAALMASCISLLAARWVAPAQIPLSGLPFGVTCMCLMAVIRTAIPSLVPVDLYAITSPEEHLHRYHVAQVILGNFRKQLQAAMQQKPQFFLYEQASEEALNELRKVFDAIDTDSSQSLSFDEVRHYLDNQGAMARDEELHRMFKGLDVDKSGLIDVIEFSELMLRHQYLLANSKEFLTYFLPIDADKNDNISFEEMNIALLSAGQTALTADETAYLTSLIGNQGCTWNRFIELLLVLG